QLMQQFEQLRRQQVAQEAHAGDIAPWSVEAGDKAKLDGVAADHEDDRYRRARCLDRECRGGGDRGDRCHPMVNQIGCQHWQLVVSPLGPAVFNPQVLTLDVAGLFQALAERRRVVCERLRRATMQKPNHRQRRLLRARRDRPCRRTAEKRDELAPAAHSITSSARASNVGGISRPSALAAFRLITSSYLVGACTGRSAGFSPLRIRSTYSAARRKGS